MIAEWIADELAVGRTDLQTMLDTSPYPRPALRTVAEDCDFRIVDGQVSRNDDYTGESWFVEGSPLENRGSGVVAWTVDVVDPESSLRVPRALISVLGVPRMDRVVLRSKVGAHLVSYVNRPMLGPVAPLVDGPGRTTLVFDSVDRTLAVEDDAAQARAAANTDAAGEAPDDTAASTQAQAEQPVAKR